MLKIHGKTSDGKEKVYEMSNEELEAITASEFKVCVGIAQTGNAVATLRMMSAEPLEFPGIFKALDLAEEIATTNVTISKAIQNPVVEKVMNFFEKKPFRGSEIYDVAIPTTKGGTITRQVKEPKNTKSKRGRKPAPVLQEVAEIVVVSATEEPKASEPKVKAEKTQAKAPKEKQPKAEKHKAAAPKKAEKPKTEKVAPKKVEKVSVKKTEPKATKAEPKKAEAKTEPKNPTPAQEKAKKELEKIKASPAAKAIVNAVNTADRKPSKKPSLDELISIAK